MYEFAYLLCIISDSNHHITLIIIIVIHLNISNNLFYSVI